MEYTTVTDDPVVAEAISASVQASSFGATLKNTVTSITQGMGKSYQIQAVTMTHVEIVSACTGVETAGDCGDLAGCVWDPSSAICILESVVGNSRLYDCTPKEQLHSSYRRESRLRVLIFQPLRKLQCSPLPKKKRFFFAPQEKKRQLPTRR